jgi:hypothetical protein
MLIITRRVVVRKMFIPRNGNPGVWWGDVDLVNQVLKGNRQGMWKYCPLVNAICDLEALLR